ncbi:unnamed protein product [Chironomus riparius]|uniref:DUF4780 domain-containing protein n=1 Tax=Chironomus riparius TaxID=315576 RepID=A0A9N9S1E1_9DIPT|nr:unnamed protein product [Chironomus riparius]
MVNPQSYKLYIYHKDKPFVVFNHNDATNVHIYLDTKKDLFEKLNMDLSKEFPQLPNILHVRPETGIIVSTFKNEYSRDWAANELKSLESPFRDCLIQLYKPKFKVVALVPNVINPEFSKSIIAGIIKDHNSLNLNAQNNWAYARKGQSHTHQKYHITVDTRSLYQLKKRNFKMSLGSEEIQLEVIDAVFGGKTYGQSEGFQAVFSSLDYPLVMLGKDDAQKLSYELHDKKQRIHNARLPVIESVLSKNGIILVECINQFSLEWVIENISGLELKQNPIRQYKFSAFIPTKSMENFNVAFVKARIEAENAGFNAYAWEITLKNQFQQYFEVDIICDDESVFNISKQGFRVAFEFEVIKLDYVGVVGDNHDY